MNDFGSKESRNNRIMGGLKFKWNKEPDLSSGEDIDDKLISKLHLRLRKKRDDILKMLSE